MLNTSITFDELPGAVSSLVNLVRELANEVRELRAQLTSERSNAKSNSRFIGIPEACEILGKAKSTVYRLANEGKVPAYKVPGPKDEEIERISLPHQRERRLTPGEIQAIKDMRASPNIPEDAKPELPEGYE